MRCRARSSPRQSLNPRKSRYGEHPSDRMRGDMMRVTVITTAGALVVAAALLPVAHAASATPAASSPPRVAAHGPGTPKHAAGDIDGDGRSDLVAGKEHEII